jgi:uncharacterized lipoprotein YmbA
MKTPKDHKLEEKTISLYDLEGNLETAIDILRQTAIEIIDPQLEFDGGYDGVYDAVIKGYRLMTEKELEQAKKQRKQERERNKKKKEEVIKAKKEKLSKLAEEFGINIKLEDING